MVDDARNHEREGYCDSEKCQYTELVQAELAEWNLYCVGYNVLERSVLG
jgi:hypothetical protein